MFDTLLKPQQAGVKAGLPSPADYIRHPEASSDGDRVIIDRAVEAPDGSIVVAFWNGEFTIKHLDLTHKSEGYIELIELRPAHPNYPVVNEEDTDYKRGKALEARPLTTSTSCVRGRWLTASTACTAQRPWSSVPSNTHEKTARAKQTHLPTPRSTTSRAQEPNDPLERRYRTKMKISKQWNQRRLLYSSGQYG